MLIQDYGVDPSLRAIPTYSTPLHGAASSELQNKVETIDELLGLVADINALCYAKKSRVATALEIDVKLFLTSPERDHEQQSKDAIASLLRKGTNYPRDSQGKMLALRCLLC